MYPRPAIYAGPSFSMGALFYSSVKCTGAPKYAYKDILVHRYTLPMNETTQGIQRLKGCSVVVITLSSINVVNRHWARLVLGCLWAGKLSGCLQTSHLGRLSLLPFAGW